MFLSRLSAFVSNCPKTAACEIRAENRRQKNLQDRRKSRNENEQSACQQRRKDADVGCLSLRKHVNTVKNMATAKGDDITAGPQLRHRERERDGGMMMMMMMEGDDQQTNR